MGVIVPIKGRRVCSDLEHCWIKSRNWNSHVIYQPRSKSRSPAISGHSFVVTYWPCPFSITCPCNSPSNTNTPCFRLYGTCFQFSDLLLHPIAVQCTLLGSSSTVRVFHLTPAFVRHFTQGAQIPFPNAHGHPPGAALAWDRCATFSPRRYISYANYPYTSNPSHCVTRLPAYQTR